MGGYREQNAGPNMTDATLSWLMETDVPASRRRRGSITRHSANAHAHVLWFPSTVSSLETSRVSRNKSSCRTTIRPATLPLPIEAATVAAGCPRTFARTRASSSSVSKVSLDDGELLRRNIAGANLDRAFGVGNGPGSTPRCCPSSGPYRPRMALSH